MGGGRDQGRQGGRQEGSEGREGREPGREARPLLAACCVCVCRYEQYLQFAREMGLGSLISISMVDLGDAYLTTITVGRYRCLIVGSSLARTITASSLDLVCHPTCVCKHSHHLCVISLRRLCDVWCDTCRGLQPTTTAGMLDVRRMDFRQFWCVSE